MLCLADSGVPCCGEDVDESGIVGTAAIVVMVGAPKDGADTDPAATGMATEGGPAGGVREPSSGTVVAWGKSLRDTPVEAVRPAEEPHVPVSSLLMLRWLMSCERPGLGGTTAPTGSMGAAGALPSTEPRGPDDLRASRRLISSCKRRTSCSCACLSASHSLARFSHCWCSCSQPCLSRSRSCRKSSASAWALVAAFSASSNRRLVS
mmetsp:Transcript_55397/g.125042  ORF Transcript_55397/g.125042 Transcript_55397/m.125042 type:complete len:207 (-) Transcript_55397:502-1122(-)